MVPKCRERDLGTQEAEERQQSGGPYTQQEAADGFSCLLMVPTDWVICRGRWQVDVGLRCVDKGTITESVRGSCTGECWGPTEATGQSFSRAMTALLSWALFSSQVLLFRGRRLGCVK